MTGRPIDIAIAGGGLAGGLAALALQLIRPDLAVVVIEQGPALGGNHRWSWFASDLAGPRGEVLLEAFAQACWTGYDVRFPARRRTLQSQYCSLASADFDAGLRELLPPSAIRCNAPIAAMDAKGVTLADGERIAARTVIDARGQAAMPGLTGGWQVFMGRHLRTDRPHGLTRPVIMDAAVDQHGAYRFVYTLPLAPDELFVEDTYYADSPALDTAVLAERIDRYCAAYGWTGATLAHETGVLPVITGGDIAALRAANATPGVALIGARGGFVHPLTSYTLPFAVETALAIADAADLPSPALAAQLDRRAADLWQRTGFYRQLGRMLFGAGEPAERYRIFERFYGLPEQLVERFYAARSTRLDQARILCGKPPVPIFRAIGALAGRGAPLERIA